MEILVTTMDTELLADVWEMLSQANPDIIENPQSARATAWAFVALSSTVLIPEAEKFRGFAVEILKRRPALLEAAANPAWTLEMLGRRIKAARLIMVSSFIGSAAIVVEAAPTPEGECDCLACQLRRTMEARSDPSKDSGMPAWLPN